MNLEGGKGAAATARRHRGSTVEQNAVCCCIWLVWDLNHLLGLDIFSEIFFAIIISKQWLLELMLLVIILFP